MRNNLTHYGNNEYLHSGYSPEQFGFTKQERYRNWSAICDDECDGNLLYKRSKEGDTTGKENGGYLSQEIFDHDMYFDAVTNPETNILSQIISFILKQRRFSGEEKIKLLEAGVSLKKSNKIKAIVKNINKSFIHYGLDVSAYRIAELEKEYDESGNTESRGEVGNRNKTSLFQELLHKITLFTGGSLCNEKPEDLILLLSRLSSPSYAQGDQVVLTYFNEPEGNDKNNQIQSLKDRYSIEPIGKWITKGFSAMGLQENEFEFALDYEESHDGLPARIKVGVKLLQDKDIPIGDGIFVKKAAGDYLWSISSRRYTHSGFADILKKSNLKPKKTISKDGISVVRAVTKRKKIPKVVQKTVIGSAMALLFLRLGGEAKSRTDNMQKKAEMQRLLELRKNNYTKYGIIVHPPFEELKTMKTILQHRYEAGELDNALDASILDRFESDAYRETYADSFGTMRLGPSNSENLIWDKKYTLIDQGINLIPNVHFFDHKTAIWNSYHYKGKDLEFVKVDKVVKPYFSEMTAIYESGEIEIFSNKAGIIHHNGSDYLVFQKTKDGPFLLQQRGSNLHQDAFGPQQIISDIVGRGQVAIIAEKIRMFLVQKYGSGNTRYIVNGQEQIVKYLLDFYANGGNLEKFMNLSEFRSDDELYEIMDIFVCCFLLPEIGDELEKENMSNVYNLDRSKIKNNQKQNEVIKNNIITMSQFSERYLGIYGTNANLLPGECKNIILSQFLYLRGREKVSNTQQMRCRLEDNQKTLKKAGLEIPTFPNRDERDFASKISNYPISKVGSTDIETNLHAAAWPRYVMSDGSLVNFALYHEPGLIQSFVGNHILLGQTIAPDALWKSIESQHSSNEILTCDVGFPRGRLSKELSTNNEIALHFLSQQIRTSDATKHAYEDYLLRKSEREKRYKK